MKRRNNYFSIGTLSRIFFAVSCLWLLPQLPALADNVVLTWNPSPDANVAGYKIYYSTTSHNYLQSQDVGNTTTATISGLSEGTTYYFAATTYDASGNESDFSNEASQSISNAPAPVSPPVSTPPSVSTSEPVATQPAQTVSTPPSSQTTASTPASPSQSSTVVTNSTPAVSGNQLPTLDALPDLTISENAAVQTILLSGISSGSANEKQTLQVAATSNKASLVGKLTVSYSSPKNTGILTFKPTAKAVGTATISVMVYDGGKSNNLVIQTFTLTIVAPGKVATTKPTTPTTTPVVTTPVVTTPVATTPVVTTPVVTKPSAPANPTASKPITTVVSANAPKISKQLIGGATLAGKTISFAVAATGSAPLKYQWKLNGQNIASATDAVLILKNVTSAQGGSYSVSVSNGSGSIESAPGNLFVSSTVSSAVSSPVVASSHLAVSVAATLTCTNCGNGHFSFLVTGTPDAQYVVQASTNLTDWVSIQTNASPFLVSDPDSAKYAQRFYRTYSAQQ